MQHQISNKNSSNLIKSTEDAKRKAKHRLIGSMFLLLLALIVLLNVTTRVKPIQAKPKSIEIQRGNQIQIVSDNPIQVISTPTVIKKVDPLKDSSAPQKEPKLLPQTGFKASVIKTIKTEPIKTSDILSSFKVQIIDDPLITRPTPADILNNHIENYKISRYYIQLAASHDKQNLNNLRQELANKYQINSFIQETTLQNKTIYRLRIGPFASKASVNAKLSQLNNKFK